MRKLLIAILAATAAVATLRALPPPTVERAIATQRALVQKSPTAERWNDLGNLLELGRHKDEAQQAYEKALALDPKLVTAHYNLALLLRQSGAERKAMQHLRKVTDLEPSNAWAWFQMGAVYERHDDRGPAIRAYARAYAIDPRLSFTDVNPQVVDSKLTTEALLVANQARSTTTDAPREYEEPRRIAKLLLPQLPATGATPAPATAAPATTAPAGAVTAQPAPPAQPMPSRNDNSRVLRPQDLQHGGSTRGGTQPGVGTPSQGTPSYSDLLRQRLLEQQQEQEQNPDAQPDAQQPNTAVPGVGIYVPAPRSSGELEQRLDLPATQPPPPPQPAR